MQFVTDCATDPQDGRLWLATYVYADESRRGSLRAEGEPLQVVATAGTFGFSLQPERVLASEFDGVAVYTPALQRVAHFKVGISYQHAVCGNTLVSTSSDGTYHEIDLAKEAVTTRQLRCQGGPCWCDVWSAHLTERAAYLGCDLGTLVVQDRRSADAAEQVFSGGVTYLGAHQPSGGVEAGTYLGEYARLAPTGPIDFQRKLSGIVWRIHRVTVGRRPLLVVAQSYDGIGVYTAAAEHLYTIPTDDLVYALRITGADQTATVIGYNYYHGTLVTANLWDLLAHAPEHP